MHDHRGRASEGGKKYPPDMGRRPRAEVHALRWLAHRLICGDGMSFGQAQAAMLAEHGVRRSIGIIHRDVAQFDCGGAYGQPCRGAS